MKRSTPSRSVLGLTVLVALFGAAPGARADCSDYPNSIRWVSGMSFSYFEPGGGYSQGTTALARAGAKVLALDEQMGLVAFEELAPGELIYRGGLYVQAEGLDAAADRAYLAGGSGFTVVNTADLQNLSTVATLPIEGAVNVDVEGGYAYVATYQEITIIRIVEPGIAVAGRLLGEARDVAVRNGRAYVLTPAGLRVANVASPGAPYYLGTPYPAANLLDLAFQGDYLHVEEAPYGLRTFDLADPDHPVLVASVPLANAGSVFAGSAQVVVGGGNDLYYVDTSDPTAPVVRGRHRGLPVRGGAIHEGFAYLASGFYGVQAMNLGTGNLPAVLATLPEGAYGRDLAVTGGTLALIRWASLETFDVSDPSAPVPLGSLPLGNGRTMAVQGELAYLIDASTFKVVDLSAPATPVVVGSLAGVAGDHVALSGDRAFVVASGPFLWIIDISSPANPVLLGTSQLWGGGEFLIVAVALGDSLVVGDNFEGSGFLNLWDVSDPNDVQWVDGTFPYDRITGLAVAHGRLVLTTERAISAYDPGDLWSFQGLSHHSFDGVIASGPDGRLYTANGRGGFCVYSYDGTLTYVGSGSTPGGSTYYVGIAEAGGHVYVTDFSGLHVFAPACEASAVPPIALSPAVPELRSAPNPFTTEARLYFTLEESGAASLRIFDAAGRRLRTLFEGRPSGPGRNDIVWDGRDDQGRPVGAGVFFVRLSTPARSWTRRIERVR